MGILQAQVRRPGRAAAVALGLCLLAARAATAQSHRHDQPAWVWFSGKRVAVESFDGAGFLGREVGALGSSIVASGGGDLTLPTVHEDLPSARRVAWVVELVDSEEHSLVRIQSAAPLPDPLVISGSLVPAEAVRAHLRHVVSAEFEDGAYPVMVALHSKTSWVVP